MKVILAFKNGMNSNDAWYWKTSAKLIQWWTKSKYFHVEIAFKDKWVAAHTDTGIRMEQLKPLYDNNYEYFELEVPNITKEQERILIEFIKEQENKGYDWKGIFLSQILFLNWEHPEKWFCSEIVAKVLELLYVQEFMGIAPNKLSPGEIHKILLDKIKKI